MEKTKILGCPSPCGPFLKMKPAALYPSRGAPELIIPLDPPAHVSPTFLWLPWGAWVGSPSRTRAVVYSVRAEPWAPVRPGAPRSLEGARLSKGVCCSARLQEREMTPNVHRVGQEKQGHSLQMAQEWETWRWGCLAIWHWHRDGHSEMRLIKRSQRYRDL